MQIPPGSAKLCAACARVTRDVARADIFDYIEAFDKVRRRHSTLGQVSPAEFERGELGLA